MRLLCGPPPDSLGFGNNWSAEWRRDGIVIPEDNKHIFSIRNTLLTVSKFFSTDNGKEIDQPQSSMTFFVCYLENDLLIALPLRSQK